MATPHAGTVGPTGWLGCTMTTCPPPGPTAWLTCQPGTGPQQGANPQATFTPVGCNITLFTLCTPVCGQAAATPQGAGQAGTIGPTGWLTCQPPIGPTAYLGCPTVLCPQQGANPQATFTPVGCNITVFTLCTPVCGQAAAAPQGAGQAGTIGPTGWLTCQPQGANPQATFTPVGCNITVFSLCTPVCGQAANAAATMPPPITTNFHCHTTPATVCTQITCGQGANPQATFTPVGCNITVFTLCTPVCGQAAAAPQGAGQAGTIGPTGWLTCQPQGTNPQATFTPVGCNITVFTLCTPVCGQAAAAPQGTVTPATSIGCGTLPGLCNPTFMHCTTPPAAQGVNPQATLTPVGCNITIFSICTPLCGQ